jgi:hypothetical protein
MLMLFPPQTTSAIQSDEIMVKEWCALFDEAPGIDDSNENTIEVFTAVLLDLNEMMTDYFIKIALSNGLKRFKSTIPKTKIVLLHTGQLKTVLAFQTASFLELPFSCIIYTKFILFILCDVLNCLYLRP